MCPIILFCAAFLYNEHIVKLTYECDFVEINHVYDNGKDFPRFSQLILWDEHPEYPCRVYSVEKGDYETIIGSRLVVHDWINFVGRKEVFIKNKTTKKYEMDIYDSRTSRFITIISKTKPQTTHTCNDVEVTFRHLIPESEKRLIRNLK